MWLSMLCMSPESAINHWFHGQAVAFNVMNLHTTLLLSLLLLLLLQGAGSVC